MSGRVGDLSDKQAEKLTKLKESLKDVLQEKHDDIYLLRFLRARQFDLKKAEEMFRKDIEWRKKIDIDNLVTEYVPPEALDKYYGGGVIGIAKDGAVVYIDPLGMRDVKGLMYSCKPSDFLKYINVLTENVSLEIEAQNKKLGRDCGGLISIVDLDGFGGSYFWKPWIDLNKKILGNTEQHFPELMKMAICFNTPKLFMVLYSIMKPFLREGTRKKVVFFGSDWKTEILKYVDADVLPAHWGGTRVDPDGDPKCPSVVCPAGPVPKSYYLKDTEILTRNLNTREVQRAGTLEFKYEVVKPGSVLSYEFKTMGSDIGFSVKKINVDGSKTDIVGKERYNCHISPEDGQETLEEPGTYVVKFDNSYSLMRSKTLSYFVELLEPLDDEDPEFMEQDDLDDMFNE